MRQSADGDVGAARDVHGSDRIGSDPALICTLTLQLNLLGREKGREEGRRGSILYWRTFEKEFKEGSADKIFDLTTPSSYALKVRVFIIDRKIL